MFWMDDGPWGNDYAYPIWSSYDHKKADPMGQGINDFEFESTKAIN